MSLTIVGNGAVFSGTIQNFSANPYRRVDLTATISSTVDHHQAIRLLKDRLTRIPNVLSSPAPDVDILQFTPAGPQLCVRPYCSNQHYWQVYFDTNRLIRESFGEAGFPPPMPAYLGVGCVAGADWTTQYLPDLWVMSPTSYRTAPPRVMACAETLRTSVVAERSRIFRMFRSTLSAVSQQPEPTYCSTPLRAG